MSVVTEIEKREILNFVGFKVSWRLDKRLWGKRRGQRWSIFDFNIKHFSYALHSIICHTPVSSLVLQHNTSYKHPVPWLPTYPVDPTNHPLITSLPPLVTVSQHKTPAGMYCLTIGCAFQKKSDAAGRPPLPSLFLQTQSPNLIPSFAAEYSGEPFLPPCSHLLRTSQIFF